MGKLIVMQQTVNLLALKDPESLKSMGEDWEPSGPESPDRYFTKIEEDEGSD